MYSLIKRLTTKELLVTQTPTLVVSLTVAEVFYKFGSFLLEAAAFLLTWFILDALISTLNEKRQL